MKLEIQVICHLTPGAWIFKKLKNNMQVPNRTLLIYHITQSKKSVSVLSLKRTIGVSYNTALLMKHNIQQAMKEQDDSKPLTDFIPLDDAYWGGKKPDANVVGA